MPRDNPRPGSPVPRIKARATPAEKIRSSEEEREALFWKLHALASAIGTGAYGGIGLIHVPGGIIIFPFLCAMIGIIFSVACYFVYPLIAHGIMDDMNRPQWVRALAGSFPILATAAVTTTLETGYFWPISVAGFLTLYLTLTGVGYFALHASSGRRPAEMQSRNTNDPPGDRR